MSNREEKIRAVLSHLTSRWTYFNGGKPVPIEISIEFQTQLEKYSDYEINRVYKKLVKSL
jgi:hypothetical protein